MYEQDLTENPWDKKLTFNQSEDKSSLQGTLLSVVQRKTFKNKEIKIEGTCKASLIPWKQCPGSSKPENLLDGIHWMKTAK